MATIDVVLGQDNSELVMQASEEAIERALEAIGLTAEGYAKKKAPVGTPESTGIPGYIGGTLRNSISHDVKDNTVYIGTNVYYAVYVELGTVRMKAQPYLRPAVTDHLDNYKNITLTQLRKG